jgi:hypothetical protein
MRRRGYSFLLFFKSLIFVKSTATVLNKKETWGPITCWSVKNILHKINIDICIVKLCHLGRSDAKKDDWLSFWISDHHVSVRERPGVPESGRQLDVSVPARGRRMPWQSTRGYFIRSLPPPAKGWVERKSARIRNIRTWHLTTKTWPIIFAISRAFTAQYE